MWAISRITPTDRAIGLVDLTGAGFRVIGADIITGSMAIIGRADQITDWLVRAGYSAMVAFI